MNLNEIRQKSTELAASYFANWKAAAAALDYDEERKYYNMYEAARCMAALMDIEEKEIQALAWSKYGEEIGKIYDENNATW